MGKSSMSFLENLLDFSALFAKYSKEVSNKKVFLSSPQKDENKRRAEISEYRYQFSMCELMSYVFSEFSYQFAQHYLENILYATHHEGKTAHIYIIVILYEGTPCNHYILLLLF